MAGFPNVLPSSTNPTMPFTRNTVDEHLDMMMVCHHLDRNVPEDISFADSRIRPETIGAEDVLHDMGIISMMGSDSQAMDRPGEVITRAIQIADKMKKQRGPLPEDEHDNNRNDNFRIKRYVSKFTINPAITHGISDYVGSIEVGKMSDLVLWQPAIFGAKLCFDAPIHCQVFGCVVLGWLLSVSIGWPVARVREGRVRRVRSR